MLPSETRRLKNNAAVKARYERYHSEGLCRCGRERSLALNLQGKPETRCGRCIDAQNGRNRPSKPKPSANWHTGHFYRVLETGEIGEQIECPCTDPIILEFKDSLRDAFHLREVEASGKQRATASIGRGMHLKSGARGRPKGMEQRTVKKMLKIYRFLQAQSTLVYRRAIENAVGFNCTRPLMYMPSQAKQVTLESLGIVERLPGERTWVAWQLTELGRQEGEEMIRSLK